MIAAWTVEQIRAVERAAIAGLGDAVLMGRAAWAVATAITDRLPGPLPGRSAVLLVGSGNNGGDALFVGALLRRRGMIVRALLTDPAKAHPGGLAALRRAGGRVTDDRSVLDDADVIVDGLVGIAATPPLRGPAADLVEAANQAVGLRVAVDVASGVDPDTGREDGAVFAADLTVTIGAAKPGVLIAGSTGDLVIAGIGMDPATDGWADVGPADLVAHDDADVAALVPEPGATADKFSGGVPGILAGSAVYPGAAVLAVGAAVSLRPGLVRYAGGHAESVLARWPEVVAAPSPAESGRVQAWAAGPGMGTDGGALALLRQALDADVPVLVDADGLTLLAANPALLAARTRRGAPLVLSPHAGEFARLFGDLDPADRLRSVRAAAVRSGATVLLKGHRTLVAAPDGRTSVNLTGTAALATAGSGDVLSGVIGSLLAAGLEPFLAASLAAHIHGRAGEAAAAAGRPGAQALWPYLAPAVRGAGAPVSGMPRSGQPAGLAITRSAEE